MRVATGLFAPELSLGIEAMDSATRSRLQRYLRDVLEARNFPIHTAVAWNALHFGFEPSERSYDERLLAATMPTVELGGRAPALPVGALAWVQLGGTHHEVWAEVVAKDGRPPGVDNDGSAPVTLAGRPAAHEPGEDGRPIAVVSEALICDFEAFGPLPDLSGVLGRLQRRGRLGAHQHVCVDAVYDPADAAADSDTWFYARWLFDTQRHLLQAGPLGAGLLDADDNVLRAALVASLSTVDLLLTSIPGVVRFGDYALLTDWVSEIDLAPNLPLHRADIDYLIVSMAGAGRDTNAPTATALAPRLEAIAGAPVPPPGRPDATPVDPLGGIDYLRVTARTSRWLADRLDDTGGVVDVRGARRLLRVDDTWPWGGLWRSEPWGPGHPLTGIPADEPLAIGSHGWATLAEYLEGSVADLEAAVAAALRAETTNTDEDVPYTDNDVAVDDETAGSPDDNEDDNEDDDDDHGADTPPDDVAATVIEGHATLRQVDVDSGTLPLEDRFAWLADGSPVTVRLSHAGDIDADQLSQTAKAPGGARLEGLDWPPDFFGGIRLHVSAITGGRVLFAATLPLADDSDYAYQFDPAVIGRAAHDTELTLAAVAVAALARHGRPATDGTRRATATEITRFCFGPDIPDGIIAAVTGALSAVVATGRIELIGSEYAWSASKRPAPRRSGPTGWEPSPVRREAVRVHYVPGFLRRLHPGWKPSLNQLALYADHRAAGIMHGPEVLAAGVTYVPGHQRGSRASVLTAVLAEAVSETDGRSPAPDELEELFDEWDDT